MDVTLPQARIYYVLCPSFQGATLLSAFLNNHSQITSLGDTFPTRKFDQICTCGKKVSECDFWQELYDKTSLSKFSKEDLWLPSYPKLIKKNGRYTSRANQFLNILMLGLTIPFGRSVWKLVYQPYQEYYKVYIDFVEFVTQKNQSRVFIDGSKQIFKPIFIQSYSNNKVLAKVIHLTRSPFDYAYSCYKFAYKKTGIKAKKNRIKIIEDAAKSWLLWHNTVLRLKKFFLHEDYYLRLSYEAFCEHPKNHIESILDFLELKHENLLKPVIFPKKYHLMGNDSIFDFDGKIKLSTWNSKLSTDEITRIHEITKPLLVEFDYISDKTL